MYTIGTRNIRDIGIDKTMRHGRMIRMKRNGGFTIIELIVYVGLLSILIAVMSQVFLATVGVKVESEGSNRVQQDGRYILSRITYDIRRAKEIVTPALGATAGSLSLTITENGTDVPYVFSTGSGNMTLTVNGEATQLNSAGTQIAGFTVTRLGNSGLISDAKDTLQIGLNLIGRADVRVGQQVMDLHSSVGLR